MSDHDFDREKVCYEQNFQHARTLNAQMNQVPVLAMTLTGGLWFGAGVASNLPTLFRFALLIFASLCDLALILATLRIRDVFESYLEKISAFCPSSFASGKPANPKMPWLGSYSMISIYCALILLGATFSAFAAFWNYWPFEFSVWCGVATYVAVLAVIYTLLFRRGTSAAPHPNPGT
jgi:hypothetical protein